MKMKSFLLVFLGTVLLLESLCAPVNVQLSLDPQPKGKEIVESILDFANLFTTTTTSEASSTLLTTDKTLSVTPEDSTPFPETKGSTTITLTTTEEKTTTPLVTATTPTITTTTTTTPPTTSTTPDPLTPTTKTPGTATTTTLSTPEASSTTTPTTEKISSSSTTTLSTSTKESAQEPTKGEATTKKPTSTPFPLTETTTPESFTTFEPSVNPERTLQPSPEPEPTPTTGGSWTSWYFNTGSEGETQTPITITTPKDPESQPQTSEATTTTTTQETSTTTTTSTTTKSETSETHKVVVAAPKFLFSTDDDESGDDDDGGVEVITPPPNYGGCCPDGWIHFKESCYYFSAEIRGSWGEAKFDCEAAGATLFVPDSLEEYNIVRVFARTHSPNWIGISGFEPNFETDGGIAWKNLPWLLPLAPTRGQNPGVNCVGYYHNPANPYIHYFPCTNDYPYFCERNSTIINDDEIITKGPAGQEPAKIRRRRHQDFDWAEFFDNLYK